MRLTSLLKESVRQRRQVVVEKIAIACRLQLFVSLCGGVTLAPLVCTKLFLDWSRMAFIALHKEVNSSNLLYDLVPVDDFEVLCA